MSKNKTIKIKTKSKQGVATETRLVLGVLMASALALSLSFAGAIAQPKKISPATLNIAKTETECIQVDQAYVNSTGTAFHFIDVPCVEFTDHDNNPDNNIIDLSMFNPTSTKTFEFTGDFDVYGNNFEFNTFGFVTTSTVPAIIILNDSVSLKDLTLNNISGHNSNGTVAIEVCDNSVVDNVEVDAFSRGFYMWGDNPIIKNSKASNGYIGFVATTGEVRDSEALNNYWGFQYGGDAELENVKASYNQVGFWGGGDNTRMTSALAEYNSNYGIFSPFSAGYLDNVTAKNNRVGAQIKGGHLTNVNFSSNEELGFSGAHDFVLSGPATICGNGETDMEVYVYWDGYDAPILWGNIKTDDIEYLNTEYDNGEFDLSNANLLPCSKPPVDVDIHEEVVEDN